MSQKETSQMRQKAKTKEGVFYMLKEIEKIVKITEKNKELKSIKKEKGITLIALIVTIMEQYLVSQ